MATKQFNFPTQTQSKMIDEPSDGFKLIQVEDFAWILGIQRNVRSKDSSRTRDNVWIGFVSAIFNFYDAWECASNHICMWRTNKQMYSAIFIFQLIDVGNTITENVNLK